MKRGEPAIRFRLHHLFLATIWVAVVTSLWEVPWIAAGVGSLMVLCYSHFLSLGRTSPLAAFAFVVSGVVAGIASGLPYLVAELKGKKSVRLISDGDIGMFFVANFCFGLTVAAIVAVVVAIDKRDEWFNHL